MPPKDRIWVTKRRRSRVSDRLGTNPAGIRMFRVAANGSWRGCWAQTSRFGASRFVPKIEKTAEISRKIPEDRVCAVRRAQIQIGGSEKARLHLRCVRSKPETRELAVFLRRCIITTLAPRRRMRAALVKNSVLALAPAQTGSRLAGSGPTDGCATAFSPLPPQMRPSQPSLRRQPAQSARRPRWSAPATGHRRRVGGGGVPPTGVGDS